MRELVAPLDDDRPLGAEVERVARELVASGVLRERVREAVRWPDSSLTYLSGADIDRLALADADILAAVSDVLAAQGRGETVIEPRVHLFPGGGADGHFNVLRGALPLAGVAGVKVVGDYVGNGAPRAAVGARAAHALRRLHRRADGDPRRDRDHRDAHGRRDGRRRPPPRPPGEPRARPHRQPRHGRVERAPALPRPARASRRCASTRAPPRAATALAERLGRGARPAACAPWTRWEECVRGADVVVEATRLVTPEPLLRTEWIAPGALVVPYGTVSAVALDLTDVMDKVVVDDWGQARAGPLGALRAHVDSGRLSEATLHAELGQIVCGARPGREHDSERILLWHRGLSLTDIALGRAMLARAQERGPGDAAALPLKRARPAGERTPRPASLLRLDQKLTVIVGDQPEV